MPFEPTLNSVKTHPLPAWYADAKFGIFIHWGLYSVPAFAPRRKAGEELLGSGFGQTPYAEWYQNSLRIPGSPTAAYHAQTYGPDFRYEQFAPQFNAGIGGWEPASWADLFARAGARYTVLVTKHHDGFLMWNSRHPNPRLPGWQVNRDVVGELSRAVTSQGLRMGLYYSSLLDWTFTPRPITTMADLVAGSDPSAEYVSYVEAHWLELIERYAPSVLWSDIGYPPGYHLPTLFAHYYNRVPDGLVNDRWLQLPKPFFSRPGRSLLNLLLKAVNTSQPPKVPHSDFSTPEYAVLNRITPYKWETTRGIGNSFGFNQFEDAQDYQSADDVIRLLADIVSKNGNLLLNVGPRADGSLHPLQVAALEGVGRWLRTNGEAVYGTRPWERFGDQAAGGGEVRYTTKDAALYVIVVKSPPNRVLDLPIQAAGSVSVLAGPQPQVEQTPSGLRVTFGAEHDGGIPVLKIS